MNKKYYKEIAKIIKITKRWSNELRAEEFADYFEKEENEDLFARYGHWSKKDYEKVKQESKEFNKNEFLKQCGV